MRGRKIGDRFFRKLGESSANMVDEVLLLST